MTGRGRAGAGPTRHFRSRSVWESRLARSPVRGRASAGLLPFGIEALDQPDFAEIGAKTASQDGRRGPRSGRGGVLALLSRQSCCPVRGPGRPAHRRDLLRGRPPSTSCRPSVEAGHIDQLQALGRGRTRRAGVGAIVGAVSRAGREQLRGSSPPRLHRQIPDRYLTDRSIPACAGEPRVGKGWRGLARADPRVCGGTLVAARPCAVV